MQALHSLLISLFHVEAIKLHMAECKGNTLCLEESYVMAQMGKLANQNRGGSITSVGRTLEKC